MPGQPASTDTDIGQPLAMRQAALQAWYDGPVGQRVWQSEKQLLDHHLPNFFGYHLLSLGVNPVLPLAQASPIHHQIVLCSEVIVTCIF